ncbi:hypothetical protein IG631_10426 [Alternaria alternata]|nr:hypothetical protein IG631_10426 [Alternaria alternata]
MRLLSAFHKQHVAFGVNGRPRWRSVRYSNQVVTRMEPAVLVDHRATGDIILECKVYAVQKLLNGQGS